MPYAGFLRRLIAYVVDMIPITMAVAAVFYVFLGFDETLHRYLEGGIRDVQARIEFLEARNIIRSRALVLYFVYSALLESSALRGTLGKRLMGIAVVDERGRPLGIRQSWRRNTTKVLSFLPLGLGCFWILWSPRGQGWHDSIARTLVVDRSALRKGRSIRSSSMGPAVRPGADL